MFSLIIAVISIGLISSIVFAMTQYVPMTSIMANDNAKQINSDLKIVRTGVSNWMITQRDEDGQVILPASGENLVPVLQPDFLFMPPTPAPDTAWSIQSQSYLGNPAVLVCFSFTGTGNESISRALSIVQNKSHEGVFFSDTCGSTSDGSEPFSVMSYWMPASHYHDYED